MAQNVANLEAKIILNDNSYQRGMKNVDKSLNKTKMNIIDFNKQINFAFAAMQAAVLAGMFRLGKQSVMWAKEMQEVKNVFDVFLKDTSPKILKDTDNLAKIMGRSVLEMRKMTSQGLALAKSTGAVGEAMGKTALDISALAVDLASLHDTTDEQAFNALASALRGEQEPLRKYNILLSDSTLNQYALQEGLSKTTKEMTEQEKAALRLQFIFENSTEAQGDAVRTSKDFAGQLKFLEANLKNIGVSIGEDLIDPLGKAIIKLNDFLSVSSEFFQGEQIKINVDDSQLETLYKKYLNFSNQISNTWDDFLKNLDVLGGEIGRGLTAPFAVISRPFTDAAKQSQQAKNIREEQISQSDINIYSQYSQALRDSVKATEELKKAEEEKRKAELEATDKSIEALKKQLDVTQEIGERTGLSELEIMMSQLNEVDTLISQVVGSDKFTDVFKSYITAFRKNLSDEIKLKEEQLSNAEKERINLEREKQIAEDKRKLQESIAKDLELDKQIYNAQKELDDTQRRLRLESLNEITELKNLFAGLTKEEAERKFAAITVTFNNLGKETDLLNLVFEDLMNSVEETNKNSDKSFTNLTNNMNDVAVITSELADLFEDDLLNALTSVINSVSNAVAGIGSGNPLAAIGGVLSVLNAIDTIFGSEVDLDKRNDEVAKTFKESVDKFKRTIDDYSIAQKINFAQLNKPTVGTDLVSVSSKGVQGAPDIMAVPFYPLAGKQISDRSGTTETVNLDELQRTLNKAGFGDINARAIFESTATRSKVKSGGFFGFGATEKELVDYNEAAAIAEINRLIEESYRINLDNFKQVVGITSDSFAQVMISTFRSGGDVSQALNNMLQEATTKAFFNQQIYQDLGNLLGDKFSEALFEELGGLSLGDLEGLSLEELMKVYKEAFEEGGVILTDLFDKLGISIDNVTNDFNSLTNSTRNLPDFVKIPIAEQIASGGNSQVIYVYGDVLDRNSFDDKVMRVVNKDNFNYSGTMRR